MTTENGNLIQALSAREGDVICFVGAGGKKTTLYAASGQYRGRVAITSTSHMFQYDDRFVNRVIEDYSGTWVDDQSRVVAFSGKTETPNRVGGLTADRIKGIWESRKFGLILIKADGARSRLVSVSAIRAVSMASVSVSELSTMFSIGQTRAFPAFFRLPISELSN